MSAAGQLHPILDTAHGNIGHAGSLESTQPPASTGRIFVWFVLVLVMGGFTPLFLARSGDWNSTAGIDDPVQQAAWIPAYVGATWILFRSRFFTLQVLARIWPLVALVGLALSSTYWSVNPHSTMLRSVALLGTTLIGAWLAWRMPLSLLLQHLSICIAFLAIASIATVGVQPEIGIHFRPEWGNAWRGVLTHKNEFGQLMALGFGMWMIVPLPPRWKPIRFPALALLLICVIQSQSATAVLGVVLLVCTYVGLWTLRQSPSALIAAVSFATAAGVSVVSGLVGNWVPSTTFMGRDATLSGRTDLWADVIYAIQQHPLLGYGFGALWNIPRETYLQDVMERSPYAPGGTAHNGILEVGLALGVTGMVLATLLVVQIVAGVVRSRPGSPATATSFSVILLAAIALFNVTESDLMVHNSLLWVLLVALYVHHRTGNANRGLPASLHEQSGSEVCT